MYGRNLLPLKKVTETILNERYDEYNIEWKWIEKDIPLNSQYEFKIAVYDEQKVEEYSDSSRIQEAAAAAMTTEAEYLGHHAIVTDAEILGVKIALAAAYNVIALDSQSAILRMQQLFIEVPKSWVELELIEAMKNDCTLIWVKGHAEIAANEEADKRAKLRAYGGQVI